METQEARREVGVFGNLFVGEQPYTCSIVDLGNRTARVRLLLAPDLPMREVGLQFELPGANGALWCYGEVEARESCDITVSFTYLPQHVRDCLNEFLQGLS